MRLNLGAALLAGSLSLTTAASTSPRVSSKASVNATCPARTVNYITHVLPQQCLASSRRNATASVPTSRTESAAPSSSASGTEASVLDNSTASGSQKNFSTERNATGSSTSERMAFVISSAQAETVTSYPASAAPVVSTASDNTLPASVEEDSPLEDSNFLSFEDWKKQNLRKVGQSEHVGKDATSQPREPRKRPVNVHNALDSIGDDAEIDLDFSGFVPGGPDAASSSQSAQGRQGHLENGEQGSSPKGRSKSKDAGTTCKERFNYASFDCAANVLRTNSQAKSASAVLVENKDAYMLNECSAEEKFIILELCNDISIDTIVLANFEYFSSIFRTFRVSVSDKYPVKAEKWKVLGTFEARNSREVQAFLVENPVIWARYLRIEFLTHYGNEYYCPISLVRVHGTTMLEEYKHDLESIQSEGEDELEDESEPHDATPQPQGDHPAQDADVHQLLEKEALSGLHQTGSSAETIATTILPKDNQSLSETFETATQSSRTGVISATTSPLLPVDALLIEAISWETCGMNDGPSLTNSVYNEQTHSTVVQDSGTATDTPSSVEVTSATGSAGLPVVQQSSDATHSKSDEVPRVDAASRKVTTTSTKTSVNTSSSDRRTSTTTTAQNAVPTMQESFFKSVQKRLQMLESNSSLSLQYIEAQSRALRDAFSKVEQRQIARTNSFLEYLNTTVLSELRDFRQQYDQLWQSTVIELEIQRERYQQDNLAMNARLGILADEVVFQKRISILQMVMILVCLVLILFSKGSLNDYLEMPLVQSMLARSPSTKWINLGSLDTPSQSPPVTRSSSVSKLRTRHGILKGHRRLRSEDSVESVVSPTENYSPPTPVSYIDGSDGEQSRDEARFTDPEFDPSTIERPRTSPPVLSGMDLPMTPDMTASGDESIVNSKADDFSGSSTPPKAPKLVIEEATPPSTSRHLTWQLSDS